MTSTQLNVSQITQRVPAEDPQAEEATIVIFGASGDLTARKLIPALYVLWKDGYLSDRAPVVGVARRDKSDESFRDELSEAVRENSRCGTVSDEDWQKFASRVFYRRLDLTEAEDFTRLGKSLNQIEEQCGVHGRRVVYLAVAPDLFLPSVESLNAAGLIPAHSDENWLRVVVEKPFGTDFDSARELSTGLGDLLREDQIYRIDHYLGKETVQNILLFRFGNAIFEPLLNRNHVEQVQITVAESQGIERGRGGYYDGSGALRDVMQNHVLQLLCLIAMEPPSLFRANEIRDEKMKVLRSLAPGSTGSLREWAIAGQYTKGEVDGRAARGYTEEDRVPADSRTETFAAMDVRVENWRWAGVPFYLRTGKRLPERVTEIAIQFKLPPLHLFTTVECDGDMCDLVGAQPNTLVFRIQPGEAISLTCSTKRPGMQYQIHPVTMNFAYDTTFGRALPEAYERLLLDVMRGDSTLFTRSDELEAAWEFVTPILEQWEQSTHQPEPYPAGTWGPAAAEEMLRRNGHSWRTPDGEDDQE